MVRDVGKGLKYPYFPQLSLLFTLCVCLFLQSDCVKHCTEVSCLILSEFSF